MILCFLQNMWVREPEKVRAWLAKNPDLWNRAVAGFLFAGCLTGRRLRTCFGDELISQMTFDECTKEIAGDSRTVCSPDPEHIKAALEKHRPKIVVTFGKVAASALDHVCYETKQDTPSVIPIINCPHPAARQPDTIEKLKAAAKQIQDYLPQEVTA